jgi:hypothetical protein
MKSVDLQQEAFRQKILSATRLLSASLANYSLSKEWERSAMKDELAAEYVLVRSQVEHALKEDSVLFPGERQSLAYFNDTLDEVDAVLHLVKN